MVETNCTSTWSSVHGHKIYARTSTQVPRTTRHIELVHGLGVSSDYMMPTFARLSPHYRTWAPELPGFGKSTRTAKALDIGQHADVLAEWTRAVHIPIAVFLGNSVGCQVIIDLAARYPSLVEGIVLVGPTMDHLARSMIQQLWRGVQDLMHEPWSLWGILARDYFRTGTKQIYRTFRLALSDDVLAKCSDVVAAALLVRGSYDTIAPERWINDLARALPNSQVAFLPGGTHAANYTVPDDLARISTDFVRRLV